MFAFMKTLTLFIRKHHIRLLTLLAVLALWQIGVMLCEIKEFILPTPLTILAQLFLPRYASQHQWLTHISTTLSEIVFSFCVTAVVGIFAAILMTWSRILRQIITPIIILFNSLPKIALAPLFLLWFGYGIIPNVMIAFLVAFFPIVINTFTGLNAVDEDLLDLVRYLHASKWQVFVKIQLPNSLPYIFSGFKISTTLCVVGAIVGEFIASTKGLGFLMKSAQGYMNTALMFASLLLISMLGLGFFGCIALLEHWLMPWEES